MAVRNWLALCRFILRRRLLPVSGGAVGVVIVFLAGLVVGTARPLLEQSRDGAPEPSYLRIATGSVSGTSYAMGGALARLLSQPLGSQPCEAGGRCGVPGLSAVAVASEGAVANVQLVAAGLAESALVQADVAANAYAGRRDFRRTGALEELRALANLYPVALHLVVAREANVASVRDLRGKRVSIDRPRSGANVDARLILDYFGAPAGTLKLHEVDGAQAAEMLAAGAIDAFFVMESWPNRLVSDLAARQAIKILPLPVDKLTWLFGNQPFLHGVAIPEGTYAGMGEIETVGADVVWITREGLSQELAYALCEALWADTNRPVIAEAHPIAALINLESAVDSLPIPLAEGAETFYVQAGNLTAGGLAMGSTPAQAVPTPRARPPQHEVEQATQ